MFVLSQACINNNLGSSIDSEALIETTIRLQNSVSINESTLAVETKSSEHNNDLIGIQVYQDGKPYAYGLFDGSTDSWKLFLHSDKNYKFICSTVKNGKNIILEEKGLTLDKVVNRLYWTETALNSSGKGTYGTTAQDSGEDALRYAYTARGYNIFFTHSSYFFIFDNGYSFPFVRSSTEDLTIKCTVISNPTKHSFPFTFTFKHDFVDDFYCYAQPITNSFVYTESNKLDCLNLPYYATKSEINGKYPQFERYYGECDNIVAKPDNSIVIPIKSVGFKLKCNVQGITDGSVSLTVHNEDKVFFTKDNITSDFSSDILSFCFNNIEDAWKFDDYTENLTVSLKWMRGIGIEQDLGSQVIQVKRNALNNITINLNTN